jgi:hypothetical protein
MRLLVHLHPRHKSLSVPLTYLALGVAAALVAAFTAGRGGWWKVLGLAGRLLVVVAVAGWTAWTAVGWWRAFRHPTAS